MATVDGMTSPHPARDPEDLFFAFQLRQLELPAKIFQFHSHFQLNCNITKPPLILTLSISL
jgi:hypothetical protein